MASSSSTTRIRGRAASIAGSVSRVFDQAIHRAMPVSFPAFADHEAGTLAQLELLEHGVEEAGLVGIAAAGVSQAAQTVFGELGEIARDLEHGLVAVARPETASGDVHARGLARHERMDAQALPRLHAG